MEFMIRAALEKGSRIMFVCERRILVEQFSKHLHNAGIDHGVLMAKHWRFRPYEKVQIASAQTLEAMKSIPIVDIVFIDELHACMRKSIVTMIQNQPSLRIVGATATPFHPAIGVHFSNVVSVTTMAQLVEDKFLVPFRVFVAKEIDTKGLKVVAGEWKKDDLEKRGQQIVGDVVADYIRISNDVFGGYRKTICFSCGIAHGADHRTDIYDAPETRLGHATQHGLGQPIEAVQVGVDDIEPFVIFHPQHQVIAGDACVIDQNQRLTEVLLDVLKRRGNRFVAADIQHQTSAFDAMLFQVFGDALGTRRRCRRTDHNGALTPQLQGDGLTNAAARAGYQGNLTLQAHNVSP
jgi:hypothetical protein